MYLCQIFKAASHQWMRTAISRHLHSILDQTQELHCQLVDVQDVTEDHLNVLQQET